MINQTNPKDMLHTLGVCMSHFSYDQNQLHEKNSKQLQSVNESYICRRRCLFCHKDKYFFSRRMNCVEHSISINNRNIQIPCIGFQVYPALNDKDEKIVKKSSITNQTARYICSECFQIQGGHFFERKGSGAKVFSCHEKHNHDTVDALKLLGRWILDVADLDVTDSNNKMKNILLTEISTVIGTVFNKIKQNDISTDKVPPSLFSIKTALRLEKVNLKKLKDEYSFINLLNEQPKKIGEAIGICTWKSRHEVREKKNKLETPQSLEEYRSGFPVVLSNFFNGFITTIQKKKHEIVAKKRRQRGLLIKDFDETHSIKISVFIISMILSITFPGIDIWLTHIMSSICRKPKLLSSLYTILCTAGVVSHTQRHERRLKKVRMDKINPKERLQQGPNIWNVYVIDNIDFKEQSFAYGNIYDVTQATTHATLRMVFQFNLPISINSIIAEANSNNKQTFKIGLSQFTDNELQSFENKIYFLLQTYGTDFDVNTVHQELVKEVELGCKILPPNVVILESGENPCNNEAVHNACSMYFNDVGPKNGDNRNIDVACDEAIFRRLISYHEQKPEIRLLLGAWHTSKEMCNTLITIFSGYGIFNLAACIGVKYLDKLEKVTDYQATCRVLELIWVADGISLNQIMKCKNKTFKDIQNENNYMLKVWYLYFCWCGFWIGHKIGIRYGNYNMQFDNLLAFAPLFPISGKNNYSKSVTHFIHFISKDPSLQLLLQHVCSVNLTSSGHFFAFDEALERFGVKYVKQNIGKNPGNDEDLKQRISSIQTERERLDVLLNEYVGEDIFIRSERTIKSRKEALWNLVNQLVDAFNLIDSTTHEIFKDTTENNPNGFNNLFTCYELGIERLNNIHAQEIEKSISINTKGRRIKNIKTITIEQRKIIEKNRKEQEKITKRNEKIMITQQNIEEFDNQIEGMIKVNYKILIINNNNIIIITNILILILIY